MNWNTQKIGDICDIYQPKTISTKQMVDNGQYFVYGANGIIGKYNNYNHENSELLLTCRGNTCGSVNISVPKSWINGNAMVIRPNDDTLNIAFLKYLLIGFIDIKKVISGAAQPQITRQSLAPVKIPIPPIQQQQNIIKKLDFAFDAIEKAKANIEKNIENAKELFQSKLNEIFSPKGEGNKKWVFKKLSDIFDVRDGTHDSPKYQESGFALVTSKNLKKGKITLDKIKFISEKDYININKRSNVSKGDILFAMIGTIGNPVVIMEEPDFAIKNVALIKSNKENNSYFFSYYLDLEMVIKKMQDESKGTTQRFVSLGYMRNFEVPCPKIEIQNKIVKQIDLLSEQTNLLQEKYKQKLANLEELKKSILEKAFKGELI